MGALTKDILERVVWTAIQAFAGSLLASGLFDNLGIGWEGALKIAAAAAGASILKNIIASNLGDSSAPQALVGSTYDYPSAGTNS